MKTLTTDDGTSIKIFSSAKEMPIARYTAFQKLLLLESGVGSSIEAIGLHFQKLHAFIGQDMKAEAIKEAENLHYGFFSVLEGVNYESQAFACMVFSINDRVLNDLSDEGLKDVLEELSSLGITQETAITESGELKKKL